MEPIVMLWLSCAELMVYRYKDKSFINLEDVESGVGITTLHSKVRLLDISSGVKFVVGDLKRWQL